MILTFIVYGPRIRGVDSLTWVRHKAKASVIYEGKVIITAQDEAKLARKIMSFAK
jgi:hypothetical protein